ncbi:MAG TPA: CDP-alcohol phosphatidyltransferase family protein [Aquificaceae bacterium]|nr:CDP-alcohol phosphatidyltransferase family protein [Aquificaceae bacterium]HIQ49545.1 CDP-alcohol phosphatidyltransferase family protein [Aquifex aeolicus]
MNIPNILSLLRLIFSPFIPFFVIKDLYPFSLFLIIVLAITDFLDGYFARKLRASTTLGKFLDPIADKTFTFFALISYTFLSKVKLDTSIFLFLFLRDILLISGGLVLKKYNFVPNPSIYGKLTTFFVSLTLLSIGILNIRQIEFLEMFLRYFETISILFILVSSIDYTLKGYSFYKNIIMKD